MAELKIHSPIFIPVLDLDSVAIVVAVVVSVTARKTESTLKSSLTLVSRVHQIAATGPRIGHLSHRTVRRALQQFRHA